MGRRGSQGGYSGNASFKYEIERYKDKENNLLLKEEELPDCDDQEFEFEYTLVMLTVTGNSYFRPGKYDGPWENSYPDEGETEIEEVVDKNGKDWFPLLSRREEEEIKEKIIDISREDDYDYPEQDEEHCLLL